MSHCGYVQLLQPAACSRSSNGRIRRWIGENHLSGDSVQSTRHVNGKLAVFWWAFRGGPGPPVPPRWLRHCREVDSQKRTTLSVANSPVRSGLNLTSTHQMAPPSTHQIKALLLINRPRKDERLSWRKMTTTNFLKESNCKYYNFVNCSD